TQQRGPDAQAGHAAAEDQPAEPVFLDVRRERLERLRVLGFAGVVIGVEELEPPEAEQARAVRVALPVGERVMLPMNRHPLATALPGGQPEDRAEADVCDGVDGELSVSEGPLTVDRR